MTEFSHDQDELASAYLDDDATAAERARVDGDPTLLARVHELRAVREALAADLVESPSATERDAAIRAALSASNVIGLDAARARRRARIVSIAAAVLVVLGAAGLLLRAVDNQHADKSQTAVGAASTTSIGPTAERAPESSAPAGDSVANSFTGIQPSIGSFNDRPSLVAAAQARVRSLAFDQSKQALPSTTTSPRSTAAEGLPAPTTCPVAPPPGSTNEVYAAAAILQGQPVQVDVFTTADGSLTLIVTDAATCTELFSQSM